MTMDEVEALSIMIRRSEKKDDILSICCLLHRKEMGKFDQNESLFKSLMTSF